MKNGMKLADYPYILFSYNNKFFFCSCSNNIWFESYESATSSDGKMIFKMQ